jgi:hypothetical protein
VIREPPAGFKHGYLGIGIGALLHSFTAGTRLVWVMDPDTATVSDLFRHPTP